MDGRKTDFKISKKDKKIMEKELDKFIDENNPRRNKEFEKVFIKISTKIEKEIEKNPKEDIPSKKNISLNISKKDQKILNKGFENLSEDEIKANSERIEGMLEQVAEINKELDSDRKIHKFSKEQLEMLEEIRKEFSFFNRLKKRISNFFS